MINITQLTIAEMQGFGIQVPMEFILKNAFKFNRKQIHDFRNKQLEDALYRHDIALAEAQGTGARQLLKEADNIIPINKYDDFTGNEPDIA